MKLLKRLMVTCTVCGQSMKMEHHHDHTTRNCSPVSLPSPDSSIQAILKKSGNTPLSSLEEKLQTALVKRSSASSSTTTLQVKTGGQVRLILSGKHTHTHRKVQADTCTHMHTHTLKQRLTFLQVLTPHVSTSNASSSDVRWRSDKLRAARKRLSGGDDTAQLMSGRLRRCSQCQAASESRSQPTRSQPSRLTFKSHGGNSGS